MVSLRCPTDLLKYLDVVFGPAAVRPTSPPSYRLPPGRVIGSLGDLIMVSPFNFFQGQFSLVRSVFQVPNSMLSLWSPTGGGDDGERMTSLPCNVKHSGA